MPAINERGVALAGQGVVVHPDRREGVERLRLVAPVGVVGEGDAVLRDALARLRLKRGDEALRFREGQGPQQDRVHDAEDGRVRADPERDRRERHGREARAAGEPARAEAQVLQQLAHGRLR